MRAGRSRPSLGERAARSGVAGPGEPEPAAGGRRTEAGRHCWVTDPPEWPGTWPGLLVEWRQRHGAWQGRVTYAVTGSDGPVLIENWLPAARLEPR
jgi:hypothetical protein